MSDKEENPTNGEQSSLYLNKYLKPPKLPKEPERKPPHQEAKKLKKGRQLIRRSKKD